MSIFDSNSSLYDNIYQKYSPDDAAYLVGAMIVLFRESHALAALLQQRAGKTRLKHER